MKGSAWVIGALSFALLGTNLWWAANAFDSGITATYRNEDAERAHRSFAQARAVVRAASVPGASRASIVAAAASVTEGVEPFEKDGLVWVGDVGLRFDSSDRLIAIEEP
jgi:hypothetical protein